MHRIVLLFVGLTLSLVPPAAAQSNRCADCHIANPQAPGHVAGWDLSPHARGNVGCEACHGGDASTFEKEWAHRGILPAVDKASPVNRANIPFTCGNCHEGPYAEFRESRHHQLLEKGNTDVPVCTTCHGDVAADLMSPKRLEARCKGCHKEGEGGESSEFARQARQMHEGVLEVRANLKEAQRMIHRIKDDARRVRLEKAYHLAEAPLVAATDAGHAFVFARLTERLDDARRQTTALLDELANAPGR